MLHDLLSTPIENTKKRRNTALIISFMLIIITSAVYTQVANFEFINLDDDIYVTGNAHVSEGITGENIVWAFTCVDEEYWHPVLWLSHMACVHFFGMNPAGHHLINVVIHILSTLLLFFLFFRLTQNPWQSSFVAALFALHPMHVESVAWVTERKDVLGAFFWFSSLIMYVEFTEKRKLLPYFYSLFLFALGLMSKPMLVTLPATMLLLDIWPLNRVGFYKCDKCFRQLSGKFIALLIEKIPFFVCSFASCLITLFSFNNAVGVEKFNNLSFLLQINNSLTAYIKYIAKTFWPYDLAVVYPFPSSIPLWQSIGSLLILLTISVTTISKWRRYPYMIVGWSWFIITLMPVLGLVNGGLRVAMADRFSYIPGIGLFIMIAWGISDLTKSLKQRKAVLCLLYGFVIITSALLSHRQLGYWKDSITLYRHTLQVTVNNPRIHSNLVTALVGKGDFDAALKELEKALRINPYNAEVHFALGIYYCNRGDFEAAVQAFTDTLTIAPDYRDTHNKLGVALAQIGDFDAAIKEFNEELRLKPNNTDAEKNLKRTLLLKSEQI